MDNVLISGIEPSSVVPSQTIQMGCKKKKIDMWCQNNAKASLNQMGF